MHMQRATSGCGDMSFLPPVDNIPPPACLPMASTVVSHSHSGANHRPSSSSVPPLSVLVAASDMRSLPLNRAGVPAMQYGAYGGVHAPTPLPSQNIPLAPIKSSVFNLLKERYKGDKNRNRILDVIQLYLHQNGKTMAINETPLINGKIIDLSTLFLAIAGQGGYAKVDPAKGWTDLAIKMGYTQPGLTEAAGETLRSVYSKIFLSFEMQLSSKKAAQAQQTGQQSKFHTNAPNAGMLGKPPLGSNVAMHTAAPLSHPSLRDAQKLSKKRDRMQAPFENGGNHGGTSIVSNTTADRVHDNPAYSFHRNPDERSLMAECVVDLCSRNTAAVVRGLNTLTLRSAEFEARGLNLEPYPDVILALGLLLDLVNPLVAPYFEKAVEDQHYNAIQRERRGIDWSVKPDIFSVESLDDNSLLLTCLNVIRNISFEVVNEAHLAHSSKIVTHMVFLLLAPVIPGRFMPECVAYAFDILTNIGKTIDLTGRKRKFHKDSWMVDCIEDDERELLKARCTSHYSIGSSDVFVVAAHLLFPRLLYFMESTNRDYLSKSIECFSQLVQAEENVEMLNNCPVTLPPLLIEMLHVSITTADPAMPSSFHQNDSAELSARPYPMMALFADMSDHAIRDAALYAIYMLVCLSSSWRALIPTVPRALDTLRRIAMAMPRTENSSRAQQILSVLTMDGNNKKEFLRMQRDMCVAACGDEVISGEPHLLQYLIHILRRLCNVHNRYYFLCYGE